MTTSNYYEMFRIITEFLIKILSICLDYQIGNY